MFCTRTSTACAWSSVGRRSSMRCKVLARRRRRSATTLLLLPSLTDVLRMPPALLGIRPSELFARASPKSLSSLRKRRTLRSAHLRLSARRE
eukprot:1757894-Pleurochrysis_carterae.AAC.1